MDSYRKEQIHNIINAAISEYYLAEFPVAFHACVKVLSLLKDTKTKTDTMNKYLALIVMQFDNIESIAENFGVRFDNKYSEVIAKISDIKELDKDNARQVNQKLRQQVFSAAASSI